MLSQTISLLVSQTFELMRFSFLFLLFSLAAVQAYSQYSEQIRTARPGASLGPFTTGKNIFQIQSGITNSNSDFGGGAELNVWRQFNSLRYGILETFEIRSAFGFNSNEQVLGDQGSRVDRKSVV